MLRTENKSSEASRRPQTQRELLGLDVSGSMLWFRKHAQRHSKVSLLSLLVPITQAEVAGA